MISLRPYQIEIINQTRALMKRGVKSICIQAPTGAGKTALTAMMIKTAASKGMGAWFINHRVELIRQSTRAFSDIGVDHGIIAAGFVPDPRHLVQVASIQSLARRYQKLRKPQLIVWDETHHLCASSWATIFKAMPDAYHVGLSATPCRLDGKGLGNFFKEMVHGPSVEWLIDNGFLSKYRLYAPSTINVSGVHSRMGDYVRSELADAVDKPTITGDAVLNYKKYADGKRALAFCVSIAHSKHVVESFIAAGVPAAHVDGETDPEERKLSIEKFERGEILILSNVALFGEGLNVISVETIIDLAPTQSLGAYLQRCGRAFRPAPGKDYAILIDHSGNSVERHGLPDEPRTWTLEGGANKPKGAATGKSIKLCPKCFAAMKTGAEKCAYCGHIFAVQPRMVEHADGELMEIDADALRKKRKEEVNAAGTDEAELIRIAKDRGYRRPELWARHVIVTRRQRFISEIS